MIRVVDVHKTHPGAAAPTLRGVNLEVDEGKLVAILGKSGAGKSTLLRVLSGLDPFDRGEIDLAGVRVRGGERPDALHGKVGFVFQTLELFPHLTVMQNCVLAPVRALGKDRHAAMVKARALLSDLDLADKEDVYPSSLSGGQRQRVAIVRALMVEPRVLLYDEPTSALDPSLKLEVAKTLAQVAERTRTTQIVVTHDPQLARDLAQAVYVLEAGTLQQMSGGPLWAAFLDGAR
jgi:polar amino acid transport system ATP-binding protein